MESRSGIETPQIPKSLLSSVSAPIGYNTIAVARKQHLRVAGIAFIAVIFVVFVGGIIVLLQLDAVWISVAMLGGGFVYTILQARLGARLVNRMVLPSGYLATLLPANILFAMALFFIGAMTNNQLLFGGLGTILFVITRRHELHRLWSFIVYEFHDI